MRRDRGESETERERKRIHEKYEMQTERGYKQRERKK